VVQEFLEGPEYFVDTVSFAGTHLFTDIWKYKKRRINGHDFVYDCNDLCDWDDPIVMGIKHYTCGLLDALGVKYGPAHAEVIVTQQGPAIVEVGTRFDGLTLPEVNRKCVGYSPVDATIDVLIDSENFQKKLRSQTALNCNAKTVYLTSYRDGIFKSFPGEEKIRGLETFFQLQMRMKQGSTVSPTANYFTAPGFLTLVHPNKSAIEADYAKIREWEKEADFIDLDPT